jgi:hypothetical protein
MRLSAILSLRGGGFPQPQKTFKHMKYLTIAFILLVPFSMMAQYSGRATDTAKSYAATITSEDLNKHLSILASDEYEGRETGKPGQKKAAEYIADFFTSLGLPAINDDSYYQKIAFTSESWQQINLAIDGDKKRHLWEYYSYPSTNTHSGQLQIDEITFLGYGIEEEDYSDYKGVDVRGKAILIYDGEPVSKKGVSQITGSDQLSEWSLDWRKKIRLAREKGASLVFIIDRDFKKNAAEARKLILNSSLELGDGEQPEDNYVNNIFLSAKLAKQLMGKAYKNVIKNRNKMQKKGKSKAVTLPVSVEVTQKKYKRQILGENVLGYIEGSDEQLKDELVIVTAHYDHLGKRGDAVYNGADDNGSGTSTVLEITEAFVKAKKEGNGPRRSVLLMLVSGEEKGLLGSKYYVENPIFALDQTIANINIDMVGRVDEKHKDNPDYIYVIGSDRLSTELHAINEKVNKEYLGLELDYTYNAEDDPNRYYYRSDHYNFAERGIPAIFYFNGTHNDYHRTTDTVEKIQFDKMAKIGQLAFHTAWELANRDERIKVDVK